MSEANGQLPKGWTEAPLGDVLEVWDNLREPVNAKTRASRQGPYPYYGANGQAGTIDDYRYDGDYALLAEDGGYFDEPAKGVAYRATGRFWVNNHAHVLKPICGMQTPFVVHALNAMDWMPFVSGTTRLKLNQGKMRSAQFPVPPLPEQRRIVAKIEALQARSRAARESLEAIKPLLETFRQSVLAAAFRGDLTADWREQNPDVEPASGLLKRIRTERRLRWEEAELAKYEAKGKQPQTGWKERYKEPEPIDATDLPELPQGWCWTTIDAVSNKVTDGVHRKPNYVDDGVPFLTVKNLTAGPGLSFDDVKFITEEDHLHFIQRTHPENGDILVTKDGTLGVIRLIETPEVFSIFVSLALIKPVARETAPFIARMLQAPQGQEGMEATGTGIQHIHLVDLRAAVVPLAPLAEQAEISKRLGVHFEGIESCIREVMCATEHVMRLDQSILAKAFRGELVPQDPSDEPASVLLDRIRAQREAAEANGKKKTKRTPRKRSKA